MSTKSFVRSVPTRRLTVLAFIPVLVAGLVLSASAAYSAARWQPFGFGTVRGTSTYLTVEGEVFHPDKMRFRVWSARDRYMPAHWTITCHSKNWSRYGSRSGTVRGKTPNTRTILNMPIRRPHRCTLSVSVNEWNGWDRIHVQLFNNRW